MESITASSSIGSVKVNLDSSVLFKGNNLNSVPSTIRIKVDVKAIFSKNVLYSEINLLKSSIDSWDRSRKEEIELMELLVLL